MDFNLCVSTHTQSGSIKGEIYQCHSHLHILQRCHAVFHPLLQPRALVSPKVNDKQVGKEVERETEECSLFTVVSMPLNNSCSLKLPLTFHLNLRKNYLDN